MSLPNQLKTRTIARAEVFSVLITSSIVGRKLIILVDLNHRMM
jgi:hypothetical protein